MSKSTTFNRAIEFLSRVGKATPSEVAKAVGGDAKYASKYVYRMTKRGHKVNIVKDGKEVKAYEYVSGPKVVPMAAKPAVATKPVKAPVTKPVVAKAAAKKVKAPKAPKAPKAVKAPVVETKEVPTEEMLRDLNLKPTGEFAGGSYAVDPDFDNPDLDIPAFLRRT